ncbi:MAG TPA: DUF3426 domain-containing protein [Gammaproteobacteria bacterium]|nr:DUF3426 domain-containing protein [Gammaproteobacteria bacterium]
MYTQCPNCNTVFRISAQQLKAAGGRVRCGHCSHVFNALEKLLERLPPGYTPGTPPPTFAPRSQTPKPAAKPAPKPSPAPTSKPAAPAATPGGTKPGAQSPARTTPPAAKPAAPKPTDQPRAPAHSAPPPTSTPASREPTKTGGGEKAPLAPPRPWKSKAFEYKPKDKKPAQEQAPPKRRVSDESTRGTNSPSFKDIQLPGDADSQWSIPGNSATPPDFDLAPPSKSASKSEQAPDKARDSERRSPSFGTDSGQFDNMDLDDIDGFLKRLAAEVESTDVELGSAERDGHPDETLVLVDKVAPGDDEQPTPPPPAPGAPSAGPDASTSPAAAGGGVPSGERPAEPSSATFDPLATIERAPVAEQIDVDEEQAVPAALRDSWVAAQKKPRGPVATVLGILLILILVVGLAAQGAYFRGGEIAERVPALRPWLDKFCDLAGCTVPKRRDLSKLALVSRDVRSDPKAKGALRISATIINNASFAQPYPDLLVTLYDLTGTVVAQRQFKPGEYLAQTPKALAQYKADKGMPTDTPVNIELEVADPGKQAINYEFDFR